jgi:hypothetical protein
MMRLRVGIEDDVHLDALLVGAHQRSASRVEKRRYACTRIVRWAPLMALRIASIAPLVGPQ